MPFATPILIVLCIVAALITIQGPRFFYGAPKPGDRYTSIDGLRGYLGFFVFLHHASTWSEYVRSGRWLEPIGILNHFGQASVLLFFLITGFLFTVKLIRADKQPIDWLRLFVGRLLRLGPLYLVAMVVLMVLVFFASGLALRQSAFELLQRALRWATFTILGSPDINEVINTRYIMAGVVWTLPYEWMFYLALPVIAFLMRRKSPIFLVITCVGAIGGLLIKAHQLACLLSFLGGTLAAWLVQSSRFRDIARTQTSSLLVVTCFVVLIVFFEKSYAVVPTALVVTAFALIAGGNNLWGILTTTTSRLLGECSYGLYLLHGFVLFIAYRFVVGFEVAAKFSPVQHWSLALVCTPILVLLAFASFRWIEAPSMRWGARVTAALRRKAALTAAPPIV